MNNKNIDDQIQEIVDTFGMKAEVAAKAMNITVGTFRKKKSEKSDDHCFNQKNLDDLIIYIKTESELLNLRNYAVGSEEWKKDIVKKTTDILSSKNKGEKYTF